MLRRSEPWLIGCGVLALVGWWVATHHWPNTLHDWQIIGVLLVQGLPLMMWRARPVFAVGLSTSALLFAMSNDLDPGVPDFPLLFALAAVYGYRFRGTAAWIAGPTFVLVVVGMYLLTRESSPGLLILISPGYVGGVVLRLRDETARNLEVRRVELDAERQLFAALSVRNERARIAAELHDIIGHALSVMVVQAAAGRVLVGEDRARAGQALESIAEAARRGREDLHKLVALLIGENVHAPDLSMVDEMVARAAASGLAVTCRLEGDRDGVPEAAAQLGFRVVQEGLTNALRYAPGAAVRIVIAAEGRVLTIRIGNEPSAGPSPRIAGTGNGLRGLRERLQSRGGSLVAGPRVRGGWELVAIIP